MTDLTIATRHPVVTLLECHPLKDKILLCWMATPPGATKLQSVHRLPWAGATNTSLCSIMENVDPPGQRVITLTTAMRGQPISIATTTVIIIVTVGATII